ncbi:hypothetical protein EON80_13625, partial [bacterium]
MGGSGSEPGQFADLRDTVFDKSGNLWTLEGPTLREAGDASYKGNSRIQAFDVNGKFLRQFPLGVSAEPAHLAVDGQGAVYVSFPATNTVIRYGKDGRKNAEFKVPSANGLTTYRQGAQDLVAAVGGSFSGKIKGAPADRVYWLDEANPPTSTALSKSLERVADLTADGAGNLYALADINSIYIFGRDGKLKKTIGSGTATKAKDGSEVQSSVAVGKSGEIYSLASSFLARFDADGEKVTRREGVFAWYEPWNISILATDPNGRLWATSTALVKSKSMERYHYRPVLLRLNEDFFAGESKGTFESSLLGTGLKPEISSAAPQGIAFDLKPFRVDVNLPAATRGVKDVDGLYVVYDAFKNVISQGRFNLPLREGEAAKTSFTFTPPRYGAYSTDVSLQNGGKTLIRVGANFGVTPLYPTLLTLPEPVADLRTDPARQMFAGLPAVRLSVNANPKSWDALETGLAAATAAKGNVWVQFTDPKDATPEAVRAVAQRFKGRVKVYEIVNEPDLKMKAAPYLEILRPAVQALRQADPGAKIMGPACVSINLPWYQQFFEGGGGRLVDIVSFHDYEGNESIDPNHWQAKISALRELMKQNGISGKPLWQTERAIPAVRANTFSGLQQAIRINAHDDILQSLGIPAENNLHYYLNETGYSTVPSYLWSAHGPHPAVFVQRTRYALTKGLKFSDALDFGSDGNKILSGLRYTGTAGEVVALRTQNTAPQTVRFAVRGATSFRIVDSWGNERTATANGGALSLELGQLPTYVRVPEGASLTVSQLNFGRNLAPQTRFAYTGETKSDFAWLSNGILETIHSGLKGSNTKASTVWKGELPDPGIENNDSTLQNPPALTMTLPNSLPISTFVLYGLPSDNGYSALIDFDIQVRKGANWQTAATVRGE